MCTNLYIYLPKTAAASAVATETPKAPDVTAPDLTQPRERDVVPRTKPKGKSSVTSEKTEQLRRSGGGSESPIPKRAKFIKKFGVPKPSLSQAKKKTSKSKLTVEGGKQKQQRKKSIEQQKPRERKVSKTKVKEKRTTVTAKKQDESRKRSVTAGQKGKGVKPKPKKSPKEEVKVQQGDAVPQLPSNIDSMAEKLADKIIEESMIMQGNDEVLMSIEHYYRCVGGTCNYACITYFVTYLYTHH